MAWWSRESRTCPPRHSRQPTGGQQQHQQQQQQQRVPLWRRAAWPVAVAAFGCLLVGLRRATGGGDGLPYVTGLSGPMFAAGTARGARDAVISAHLDVTAVSVDDEGTGVAVCTATLQSALGAAAAPRVPRGADAQLWLRLGGPHQREVSEWPPPPGPLTVELPLFADWQEDVPLHQGPSYDSYMMLLGAFMAELFMCGGAAGTGVKSGSGKSGSGGGISGGSSSGSSSKSSGGGSSSGSSSTGGGGSSDEGFDWDRCLLSLAGNCELVQLPLRVTLDFAPTSGFKVTGWAPLKEDSFRGGGALSIGGAGDLLIGRATPEEPWWAALLWDLAGNAADVQLTTAVLKVLGAAINWLRRGRGAPAAAAGAGQ